jgi:cell division protein FtsL
MNKRAQNIIEYVLLFVIVAAAITVTNRYISRSMNARLKQVQDELNYKNDK